MCVDDLRTDIEGCDATLSAFSGGKTVARRVELLADRAVNREKPLRLPRRLEPLHLSFSSSRRLMRVLGPIVEIPALLVLDALEDFFLCRTVARQLVGDDRSGDEAQPPQQLAEEVLGRPGIAAALDEDVCLIGLFYPGSIARATAGRLS